MHIRSAVQGDVHQIAGLIRSREKAHRHLDWRSPLDWIGSQPYFVIEEGDSILAALACPPDPPAVAWLRLFVCAQQVELQDAWDRLWKAALSQVTGGGIALTAAILLQDWFKPLLESSGYHHRQDIVLLERDAQGLLEAHAAPQFHIRPMMSYDLPAVAELDAAAFDPLWQNSLPSLQYAFSQAAWVHVAESDQGLLGYQISTRNPIGGHLARLAVRPDFQGHGAGHALVAVLIQRMAEQGLTHLTVNTQSDNPASLALYHKIGFQETGERFPVLVHEL